MFKKKKKEDLNYIKELTLFTELLHHPFIEDNKSYDIYMKLRNFYINDKVIGSVSCFDFGEEKYFKFDSDLSQEVKDELRPIILKWVEDSNEYYDRKKKIENDKIKLELKESNEELLKYIKSL